MALDSDLTNLFEIYNIIYYSKGGIPLYYDKKSNYDFIQGTTGFLRAMWSFIEKQELNGKMELQTNSFINIYPDNYILIHRQYQYFYILIYFKIKTKIFNNDQEAIDKLLNNLLEVTKDLGDTFQECYKDKLSLLHNSTKEFNNFAINIKQYSQDKHIKIPDIN